MKRRKITSIGTLLILCILLGCIGLNCLEEGYFPIVRVRMKGFGSFHYVLIVGSENGDYVCIDPLEDEMTTLSDYAGRVYAVRCVWKEA